jgi:hypothetical protein
MTSRIDTTLKPGAKVAWGGSAATLTFLIIATLGEYDVPIGPNLASLLTLLSFFFVAYLKKKNIRLPEFDEEDREELKQDIKSEVKSEVKDEIKIKSEIVNK